MPGTSLLDLPSLLGFDGQGILLCLLSPWESPQPLEAISENLRVWLGRTSAGLVLRVIGHRACGLLGWAGPSVTSCQEVGSSVRM